MGLTKWLTKSKNGDLEVDFSSLIRQFATKPIALDHTLLSAGKLKSRKQEWQERSRDMFYKFGPWGALLDWRASAFSRIRFYVAHEPDSSNTEDAPIPATDPLVTAPLDMLSGGDPNKAADNWYRYRIHMDLLGESYLAGYLADYDNPDSGKWGFYSPFEVTEESKEILDRAGDPIYNQYGEPLYSYARVQVDEDEYVSLPQDYSSIQRFWRRDPIKSWLAFSPARYALPLLEVLSGQTARATAETKSRLWTAGILCLGEDGYLPPPPDHAMSLHENPQIAALMYQWGLGIKDPESPEACIPQIANADKDKVGLVSLASEFSKQLPENAELFLNWLAMTVAAPPEMLLGKGTDKYWTAWIANEDAVEIYLKPDAAALAANLYEGVVKPYHEAKGIKGKWIVAYDATPLAPDDNADTTLLRELALKGIDPATVAPYLEKLGIHIDVPQAPIKVSEEIVVGQKAPAAAPLPRSDPRALDPARPTGTTGRPPNGPPVRPSRIS